MSEHKALVETFYQAFQKKDYETMAQCYHREAHFHDEAFDLQGKAIGAMWHMLCDRGKDLALTWSVNESGGRVSAHWEATYTFSQTGRLVHNIIDAEFEFLEGRISRHIDRFDFWRWSRQALGLPGLLLGWSPVLRRKVRSVAATGLEQFMAAHPQSAP